MLLELEIKNNSINRETTEKFPSLKFNHMLTAEV